ncbi:ribosome biogenesis factor YjgA [Oceanicoccus sagamiensis]|uniref:Dual-action ribosomal maturation protein DarP n=1 Tax=Oceanicoccus sagamiensis TaxID=716816 RepID=A0A1X9NLN7_9GAMM|nr:ribosome biogenesis factor YjgA [Oceanicoccus sagamiensis]ARN74853.1 hypothetical protein BST96_12445 [Oceanicoccus sagamiensis]
MNDQDNFDDNDEEEIIYVSRSEMKRDMLELQALGEAIVKLSKGQLDTIPIEDETLAEAIHTARRIKHREGLRRQMQYIGKLMRKVDTEAMATAYQKLQDGRKEEAREFHELEKWRDHLIASGHKSIEEVMERFPDADRQHLRQIVMQANKELKNKKPPAASRKLFRYLRELSGL